MDEPRLLHRKSEHGYTNRPGEALSLEPEAVPRHYQDHLTDRAHRAAGLRARREQEEQHAEVARVIEWLTKLKPAVEASRELRGARHSMTRLARRLAAS